MIGVITGDVINSSTSHGSQWLAPLKDELHKIGMEPKYWEIYRGDSFQVLISDPSKAFLTAIKIKATVQAASGLGVRMSIGLGDITYEADKITESNGSAFINSGKSFDQLQFRRVTLLIESGQPDFDDEINLYIELGLIAIDNWTKSSARIVKLALENPSSSQVELGNLIGASQPAVSQQLKKAYYSEILKINEMYIKKLESHP